MRSRRHQRGFSLFELIVYLLVASILFATMINRYREYPAEAERANFLAVVAQLRAGVNLQMINAIARESWNTLSDLEASNPMNLMLETPSNYLGEFEEIDPESVEGRTWYFDTARGELVYTAQSAQNLYLLSDGVAYPARQIRFQIKNIYARDSESDWEGIVLATVTPFDWRSTPLEMESIPGN